MTPTRERLEARFEALAPAGRDERTATLTWYTGASVRRYDARGPFEMSFSMEPGAIRMGRLASGSAPRRCRSRCRSALPIRFPGSLI